MRVVTLASAAVAALLLVAAPAVAHPFGPPPRATITVEGHDVHVAWQAADDDAAAVAAEVGLLPDEAVDAYIDGDIADVPTPEEQQALTDAPEIVDYLAEHVRVAQGPGECDGTVEPMADFIDEGAEVTFRCPRPVDSFDLTITMLHGRNEAYRTFAFTEDGEPELAAFSVETPTHTIAVDGDVELRTGWVLEGPALWVAVVGLLAAVAAVPGGFLWWRRR